MSHPLHRTLSTGRFHAQIYRIVQLIPRGKVATYGQIAKIVGRCTARLVGYALAALPGGTDVPWQRVINHRGEISRRTHGDGSIRQHQLLKREGIRFDKKGRVDLKEVRWSGPDSKKSWRRNLPDAAPGQAAERRTARTDSYDLPASTRLKSI